MVVHKACHQTKNGNNRIFNMDVTGFAQKNKTRKIIAVTASKNVWLKSVEASFHITIVACVSANGFSVPPLFVLLGRQLNHVSMDQFYITRRTVTVATKGFVNSNIFIKLLDHFSSNVPNHVRRPISFVYDGYSSHYNTDHVEKSIEFIIILVILTSNYTCPIQPLDKSVFKPFKT